MAALTHKEKDQIIKELKKEVKELKDKIFQKKEKSVTLNGVGFGVIKKDKVYHLVNLKFDLETGEAIVVSDTPLGRFDRALFECKKFMVEKIFKPLQRG